MKKSNFEKISKTSVYIFLISLGIFILSLIPASYGAGYLSGTAGSPDVPAPSTETEFIGKTGIAISLASGAVTLISGVLAAFMSLQKAKIEYETQKLEYKQKQIDYEMQKKEIEKLHLELELEEKQKKKRSVKSKK